MVSKKIISKTFDKIIEVKHSNFLYNIEGTLREITDDKHEYKRLKEAIWKFYKETKNEKYENIILEGSNGTFFENRDGDSNGVEIPDGVKNYLKQGGEILYSVHNHPCSSMDCSKVDMNKHPSSCIQSWGDFDCMASYGIKYNISIGKDGIMITKNPNFQRNVLYYENIKRAYNMWEKQTEKGFHDKYDVELNKIQERYDAVDGKVSPDKLEDYYNEIQDLFDGYCTENINGLIGDLNNLLDERVYDLKDKCDAYYVPKSPRIY